MKDLILQYEKDFFSAQFCRNKANLESRFSKDFFEYGKSGLVYSRSLAIDSLMSLSKDRPIEIANFEIAELSEGIIIAHYVTHDADDNSYALRTSLWRIEEGHWKIYFHQGTKHCK